jgi:hypothetical protein
VKLVFHSDTNYTLFKEQAEWGHPSNQLRFDDEERTVEFEGTPSYKLEQAASRLGGERI